MINDSLVQLRIGGPSINIPDNYKSHFDESYITDNLIEIPSKEEFPLPEIEQKSTPNYEELRKAFVEAQLLQIREKVNISDDPHSFPIIDHPVIEMDGDFDSIDDFITFKKAVAVDFKRKSNNYGLKEQIGICASPICINPSIPGFDFCTYHLPDDKNFNKQIFLKRCTHIDENGRCKTPCSSGLETCTLHTKQIPKNKKSIE